jgi:hypothetical protein
MQNLLIFKIKVNSFKKLKTNVLFEAIFLGFRINSVIDIQNQYECWLSSYNFSSSITLFPCLQFIFIERIQDISSVFFSKKWPNMEWIKTLDLILFVKNV